MKTIQIIRIDVNSYFLWYNEIGEIMKSKFLWLIGVILILIGLVVGLKLNKVAGVSLTVIGMLISIIMILLEDKHK